MFQYKCVVVSEHATNASSALVPRCHVPRYLIQSTTTDSARHAMTFFNYVQQLYSLDTLDTRLTASAKTLPPASKRYQLDDAQSLQSTETYKTANGKEAHAEKRLGEPSPSRWGSFEFGFYYLVFLLAVPLMFKSVYDVSIRKSAELSKTVVGSRESVSGRPLTHGSSLSSRVSQVRAFAIPWLDSWSQGRQFRCAIQRIQRQRPVYVHHPRFAPYHKTDI